MDLVERYCQHCGAACAEADPACVACGTSLKVTKNLEEKALIAAPALRLEKHLQSLQLFNNRYRVVRQVGVGGFGAVYEAFDTHELRKVAIKEIGLAGLSTQEVIEATGSFNREVQMLSSLRHPGIPRMYEQSTDADHWYLVMDFIAGKTLEKIQAQEKGGRLPLERVLSIGVQICSVLEYLHSQRPAVIFRDIKPANIMLTPTGHLYLIDFGVARRYQKTSARDTIAFGSPGYAPPEQYGRTQTTPLSDIYSLGALLHCLLTGDDPSEHPFKFSPLRGYSVDGMRELNALIQRMVEPDPVQRPQRIGAELRRIQQLHYQSTRRVPIWIPPQGRTPPGMSGATSGTRQQMVFMPPASRPQQAKKQTIGRRVLVGGLLGAGALVALGLFDAWENGSRGMVSNPSFFEPNTLNNGQNPLVPLNGPTYWSADLRYAVVANTDLPQLEVYSVHSQALLRVIPYPDASITHIQWLTDNSAFYCFFDSSVWDVKTGQKLYILTLSSLPHTINSVSWSPDGKYIAASIDGDSSGISLSLFNAKNGARIFQTMLRGDNLANYIAWSPDSRYVAFPNTDNSTWTVGKPWSVGIMDVSTFRQVGVLTGNVLPGSTMSESSFASVSGIAWSPDGKKIAVSMNEQGWICSIMHDEQGLRVSDMNGVTIPLYAVPLWSPDGSYLAFYSHTRLSAYDMTTGQEATLSNDQPLSTIAAAAWSGAVDQYSDTLSIIGVDDNNFSSIWKVS